MKLDTKQKIRIKWGIIVIVIELFLIAIVTFTDDAKYYIGLIIFAINYVFGSMISDIEHYDDKTT